VVLKELGEQVWILDLCFLIVGALIPSNIFKFLNLTTLRLSNCLLVPPTLESVIFKSVKKKTMMCPQLNEIHQLVKHCKLIESLSITSIDFFNLMTEDDPSMKDLTIKGNPTI